MLNNLGPKLLSLIIAGVIWFQLALMAEHHSVVKLKVELTNKPETLTLEQQIRQIPFNVHGRGLDIVKLMLSDTSVEIDASDIKAGTDLISIQNYQIKNRPENLDLEFLGPATTKDISVSTDVLIQKQMRIEPNFADQNSRNLFDSKRFYLTPERVTLSGPKSKLQAMESIRTQKITLGMLRQSNFNLGLLLPAKDVSTNISQVNIAVANVVSMTRVLENIPVQTDGGRSFFPSTVTLKVEGKPSALAELKVSGIRVIPAETPDDEGLYPLEVILPEDVVQLAITPVKVRLRQ